MEKEGPPARPLGHRLLVMWYLPGRPRQIDSCLSDVTPVHVGGRRINLHLDKVELVEVFLHAPTSFLEFGAYDVGAPLNSQRLFEEFARRHHPMNTENHNVMQGRGHLSA
jgi:hypothetical protein